MKITILGDTLFRDRDAEAICNMWLRKPTISHTQRDDFYSEKFKRKYCTLEIDELKVVNMSECAKHQTVLVRANTDCEQQQMFDVNTNVSANILRRVT